MRREFRKNLKTHHSTRIMDQYKSHGEREIARILQEQKIHFVYEHPILIKEQKTSDTEKLRIWYPDFWLPKYSIIIEYWGRDGDHNYNKGKEAKINAYKKLNIDFISVYPKTLQKNLQAYLLMTISKLINDKERHFKARNKQ